MAKIVTCRCKMKFWTSTDEINCGQCRGKNREIHRYGLRFFNGTAKPTSAFWRAWWRSSDAVKMSGFSLHKTRSGWEVRQAQRQRRQKFR